MTDYLHDHETPPDGLHFDELVEANKRIGVNPVFGRKMLLAILRAETRWACKLSIGTSASPCIVGFFFVKKPHTVRDHELAGCGTYALVRIHNDKEG